MRRLILILSCLVATLSVADTLSDPGGLICRQNDRSPRVLEVERKSSGDMIVRISGKNLFGGKIAGARSMEAVFPMASCEPAPQGHWLDANLFRCIGPAEPQVRDANGENLALPTGFVRLSLTTYIDWGWINRNNELNYSLRITNVNGDLKDTGVFYPDGADSCRLMRHPEEE